jgi:hypothetical protein
MSPIVTAPLTTDTYLAGIARSLALTALAGCLLEAEPVPFGCTYFVKEPRRGLPVLWHQDGHPWEIRLGITQAVTLWIALDRADEHTGGLQVIPASHVLAAQPLRSHQGQPNVFGSEIDPLLVDETVARPLRLAPGDVSAHHPNLIPTSSTVHRPTGRNIRAGAWQSDTGRDGDGPTDHGYATLVTPEQKGLRRSGGVRSVGRPSGGRDPGRDQHRGLFQQGR